MNSAETNDKSLAIGDFESGNSCSNRLGAVCGHCALHADVVADEHCKRTRPVATQRSPPAVYRARVCALEPFTKNDYSSD